ncbi:hypothetical protein VT25_03910 [Photobacterium leiognathi subsp. mandapamensis]|nr:hypothetical protein VT25_03910 [Photobacterium leiognathi subsp. mandapamensis]
MKQKRDIINNLLSFSVIDFLGILIPLITMPILTRSLGADTYGQYLLFMSILAFGQTIIDYGVQYTGVREVSILDNKISRSNSYEVFQGLRVILAIFYLISVCVYSYFFLDIEQFSNLLIYGIPYMVGYILTSAWFYQATSDTKRLMYLTLISRLVSVLVIVFFVKSPSELKFLLLSSTYPILFSGLYLSSNITKKYQCKFFRFRGVKDKLRSGLNVFIGILSPNLYNALPTIVMGGIYDSKQFALFAIGTRICGIISIIQGVLSKSIYPFLAKSKESHVVKVLIANIMISLPIVIVLMLFGSDIFRFLLGHEFGENPYLRTLLVGMIFLAIAGAFGEGYLLPKGFDIIYRKISINVSIIAGIVSALLIYNFGLMGGALGLTFARFLFSLSYFVSFVKIKKGIYSVKENSSHTSNS